MRNRLMFILFLLVLLVACRKKQLKPKDPDYTNFKILKLTLSQMPFQDKNNDDWDILDGPDVFFNMESTGNSVLFPGSGLRYTDINALGLPLNWNFIPAYEITNIETVQFVTIYDYDTFDPNDQIGYVGFTLSEHKSGYPKTITKASDGITVTITGEWY